MSHLILYSRSYCHLCDDMLLALQQLQSQFAFTIAIVDVDADEALVRQYDELVPVLIGIARHGEAQKLCHYFLDHQAVSAFLAG